MKGEREKVALWADEMGWGTPGQMYKAIYTALVVQHKLSLIMREMDEIVDTMFIVQEGLDKAVAEGNFVATILLKERMNEEKTKLKAYERLLAREAPVKKEPKKDEITDDMISRARDYPFESLLPEELKRGRCRCPIHTGTNAMSFEVKNNYGRCYSCGWHGDSIKYVMDTAGKSFPDTVRSLQ